MIIKEDTTYLIVKSDTLVYISRIYEQTEDRIVFDGHHETISGHEVEPPRKYYLSKEFINVNWRELNG
jgi:uncharacterized protein (DUF1015 family)